MKRIVLLLVAVCVFLSGCGVIRETNETAQPVPVSTLKLLEGEQAFRIQKSAVYFYNESSDTLTAEIRNLLIGQDENPAKAAIEALIEGPTPESGLVSVAPKGMKLDFIEFSKNITNVYLWFSEADLEHEKKYILELAIANTVTDILDAKYVCVFYNGVYSGFSGVASSPLEKHTGSISEAYAQASAKYIGVKEPEVIPDEDANTEQTTEPEVTADVGDNSEPIKIEPKISEMMTTLYFVSENGGFILPEVRSLTYVDENFVETIFNELLAGPNDTNSMKSLLPAGLELLSPPVIIEDTISLSLNKLPSVDDFTDESYYASYAALIYTITGFMPGIKNVDITILGQPISDFDSMPRFDDGLQRSDFYGYIGSSAPIYFIDKKSDLLLSVQRSMEQASIWSPKQRLLEILRGPLRADAANAWPVILSGISQEDILSVRTYEDTVYVDLSQNFKDVTQGMSGKNEMLLVYSIVNTLASMDGINKVQLLIEGEQVDELAGTLCLSDPFLMNYDIIK